MPRPRRLPARDLALIALFAAVIAALGLPGTLQLFGSAVPITAQSLGVMLAGSLLGARRGSLAVLVLVTLAVAGLPLLAGGRGGLAVLAGPTAGYLLGWIAGAWVIGWLTQKTLPRFSFPVALMANLLGGIVVVYLVGIPIQAWRLDSGLAATFIAGAVYLPGDLLKAVAATAIARGVHLGYPMLGRERHTAAPHGNGDASDRS